MRIVDVMVFVTEGMHLRITNLRIPLAGGEPSATLEVAVDMWPHWIDVALDQVVRANEARDELTLAAEGEDRPALAAALAEECKAGMVAIAACASAIEALYAAVSERAPVPSNVFNAWAASRTPRPAVVHQTLQRAFRLDNGASRDIRVWLSQLYGFRNESLHPAAAFREAVTHPVINVGVERRFVVFRYENGHTATHATLATIRHLLERPRPSNVALVEWCERASEAFLEPRVVRWKATHGLGAAEGLAT